MAVVITDDKHYTDIAAAIRAKNGTDTKYKPSEMATAIAALSGAKVTEVSVSEDSNTFTVTYEGGTSVSGSAAFDSDGIPTGLSDGKGGSVTFSGGYPVSAVDGSGNRVEIEWR